MSAPVSPPRSESRWRRWRRRLPAVPVVWALALRVFVGLYVRTKPVPALVAGLADGPLGAGLNLTPLDARALVHRCVPGVADRCLPRALIVFALLARSSATDDVAFCLGVQEPSVRTADPRFAHAWVEVNGRPVGEGTDPRDTHSLLFRSSASPRRASESDRRVSPDR